MNLVDILGLVASIANLIVLGWVGRVGISMARMNQRMTMQQQHICGECGWFRIAVENTASSTKPVNGFTLLSAEKE